jgi:hypothetical protein
MSHKFFVVVIDRATSRFHRGGPVQHLIDDDDYDNDNDTDCDEHDSSV